MNDTIPLRFIDVLEILRELSAALGMRLDEKTLYEYATDLLHYIEDQPITLSQLRDRAKIYLANRDTVDALRNTRHATHQHAWAELHNYVQRILWSRIDRSLPNAADIVEEAAQVALHAIGQSLPKYGYKAKFTTWAHTIIINKFRNYLRDQRILKPTLDIVDTEITDVLVSIRTGDHPISQVEGALLAELVHTILQDHAMLYQQVFWLAYEGYKLAEIGERVGRSTSRTQEILRQMRLYIQADPRFQEWLDESAMSNTDQSGEVESDQQADDVEHDSGSDSGSDDGSDDALVGGK